MPRYGTFSSIFKSSAKAFLAEVKNFNPFINQQLPDEMQLPHTDNQDVYEIRMLHEQGSYDMFPEMYSTTMPEMELPVPETSEMPIHDAPAEIVEPDSAIQEIEHAIAEIAEIVESRDLYGPDVPIEELHDTVSEGFIDDMLDDGFLEEDPLHDNYMGLYPYLIYDPLFNFTGHMF